MKKPKPTKHAPGRDRNPVAALIRELEDIRFALDVSSIVAMTDADGKIIYVNDRFCEISQYSREELLGQTHRLVNSGYHPREFFRTMWQTIKQGRVWKGEICNRAKDGSCYWAQTTIVPFLDDKGRPYQFAAVRNEITRRKEMEEALKALPQRIIQAQEAERERISREIHDDLGQSMATLKIMIQSALYDEDGGSGRQKKALARVVHYTDQIIAKIRDLSAGLRPSTLEVLGLTSALTSLVARFRHDHRLRIRCRLGQLDNLVFRSQAINVYRIVQEALINVVKHARATTVVITARRTGPRLHLSIKDDGKGFDGPVPPAARGLGLSTMEERAHLLEGEFTIHGTGAGTEVKLVVPVALRGT